MWSCYYSSVVSLCNIFVLCCSIFAVSSSAFGMVFPSVAGMVSSAECCVDFYNRDLRPISVFLSVLRPSNVCGISASRKAWFFSVVRVIKELHVTGSWGCAAKFLCILQWWNGHFACYAQWYSWLSNIKKNRQKPRMMFRLALIIDNIF